MTADFSQDFPRYLTKIGLKDGRGLSLHSFRHGAADALRRAGFLDEQFGVILGHTSGTMTQRYGKLIVWLAVFAKHFLGMEVSQVLLKLWAHGVLIGALRQSKAEKRRG